ncbi:hypothetical protein BC828DRAFT_381710 [Blastocladiella britannica]|nr:hypothetical protein BC828DRAFT_381710 [Blastocladiella britannica]
MPSLTFMHLPSEIVLDIFAHIPTRNLVRLRSVSKTFSQLVDSPCLWRNAHFTFDEDWAHRTRILELLDAHAPEFRELKLSNVRDDVLNAAWDLVQGVHRLDIDGWLTLSNHGFSRLVAPMSHPSTGAVMQFPNLRSLHITHYTATATAFSAEPLVALAQGAPQLEHLHVWCNMGLDPVQMADVAHACPRLTSLSLSSTRWFDNDALAAVLAPLPRLQYLALASAHGISSAGLAGIAAAAPMLRTLLLHGATLVTNAGMCALGAGAPHLSTIKLYDCPRISLGIMEGIGFESVFVAPAIKHRPCFKFGLGMGFVRRPPMDLPVVAAGPAAPIVVGA